MRKVYLYIGNAWRSPSAVNVKIIVCGVTSDVIVFVPSYGLTADGTTAA